MRFVLCILAFIGAVSAFSDPPDRRSPLITEYEWKYFDYLWNTKHKKDDYIKRGLYDYSNMTPIDVDRSADGRTFVTIIRSAGVPATLHTVSNKKGKSGPLLVPYPNWSWYSDLQCDNIINVYRVAIDECNRMWVLDTGSVDSQYVCPAKLLVFDLYNDQLLFTHVIPDNVAWDKNGTGLLITPVVETRGRKCANVNVYIADVTGHAMIIFDGSKSYRLEAKEFQPETQYANFTIAGESFFLPDGLFGMALTPQSYNAIKRFLVFKPLASRSLYIVRTKVFRRNTDGGKIKYFPGRDVFSSQASAMAFSSDGTLFYGLAGDTAIGCWNIDEPMVARYFGVAVEDPMRLQFASGLKVIRNSYQKYNEYLLIMTNRLQKIYGGTMNFNEVNFRVTRAAVRDVIRGTVCDRY